MIKKTILSLLVAAAFPAAAQQPGVLYGLNADMMNTHEIGLYEVPLSGSAQLKWADPLTYPSQGMGANSVRMLSGWMRNDRLCGIVSNYPTFGPDCYKYVERDLESGVVLSSYDIAISTTGTVDCTNFFLNATYNPFDGRVYGFGLNTARNGYAFKSAPADNLNDTKIVRELGTDKSLMCGGIAVHPLTGTLYGFTWNNGLVRIDPLTGEMIQLYATSIPAHEMRQFDAMAYWPATGEFLVSFSDDTAVRGLQTTIYSINPTKGTTKVVNNLGDTVVLSALFVDGAGNFTPAGAPGAPQSLAVAPVSDDDANSTVSFTLPSVSFGGSALSGSLDWTVTANGKPVKTGSGEVGSQVSFIHLFEKGSYVICATASQGGIAGMPSSILYTAGGEVPATPREVALQNGILSWEPVTESITGAAISGVEYKVFLNAEYIATTSGTTYDLSSLMSPDFPLTPYRAGVQAVLGNNSSNLTVSNKEVEGQPMSLPIELEADEWDFDLCNTVDADGDGVAWTLYGNTYLSGYGSHITDDWLFLPKASSEGVNGVNLSFISAAPDVNMTGGTIEAWICDSPDPSAAKVELIAPQPVNGGVPVESVGDGLLNSDMIARGYFYVGIRVRSEAGKNCPALVLDIKLSKTEISPRGPRPVENLRAEAAAVGRLSATVKFTPSTLRNDGTAIEAGTAMKADVITTSDTYTVDCTPGVEASVTVATENGFNPITVVPYIGTDKGLSTTCHVFTGPDVPGMLENVKATMDADSKKVFLQWDYPETGWNGGYPSTAATQVVRVYVRKIADDGEMDYVLELQTEAGETEASFDSGKNGSLSNIEIGLAAVNMIGECPTLNTLILQGGRPHTLPMAGNFDGDDYPHKPFNVYSDKEYNGQTEFKWIRPERWDAAYAGEHEWAFATRALQDNARSRMDFPKFATTGYDKVGVHLTLWSGADAAATTVCSQAYPSYDMIEIGTTSADASQTYTTYHFNLPAEAANKPWVVLSLLAAYREEGNVQILSDYRIDEDASSVEGLNVEGSLRLLPGGIALSGYEGEQVAVCGVDGRKAYAGVAGGETFIPLQAGVYVVRVGDSLSLKTIVK